MSYIHPFARSADWPKTRCLDDAQVNDNSKKSVLPEWLDARTVAVLAALIALGALNQTSLSDIRQDIRAIRGEMGTMRGEIGTMRGQMGTMRGEMGTMRGEMGTMRGEIHQMGKDLNARIDGVREQLRADIGKLDDRLRTVETDVAAIRAGMVGFDARIRTVETHARHAIETTAVDRPGG